jgi:hypothetical protein
LSLDLGFLHGITAIQELVFIDPSILIFASATLSQKEKKNPPRAANSFGKALIVQPNHHEIELVFQFIKSHIHYHDSLDRVSLSPT